jgi:hypothetical protein
LPRFNLEGFTSVVLVLAWSSLSVGPLCPGKQNPKSFFPYVFWSIGYVVSLVIVASHRALLSVLCAIVVVACLLISPKLVSVFFCAVATCESGSTIVYWGYCCLFLGCLSVWGCWYHPLRPPLCFWVFC